jgi:hypothetical protein
MPMNLVLIIGPKYKNKPLDENRLLRNRPKHISLDLIYDKKKVAPKEQWGKAVFFNKQQEDNFLSKWKNN